VLGEQHDLSDVKGDVRHAAVHRRQRSHRLAANQYAGCEVGGAELGGKGAGWVTLTPDGKTAYVANPVTNDVSVVDVASMTPAQWTEPEKIVSLDPWGHLVADVFKPEIPWQSLWHYACICGAYTIGLLLATVLIFERKDIVT